MLVEATAAKDPARFHRKEKNRPYRDTRINPCVAMGVSQSPLADNLGHLAREIEVYAFFDL